MNENVTYMSTVLADIQRLESREKELIETIRGLEDEIIGFKAGKKADEKIIEEFEEKFKNLVMTIEEIINPKE